ncbi:MAG: rhomboid family intramembrane serine protease [Gammaproteobacteria bacterium]
MIPLKDDNPTRATPFVNYALIAGCVLVFLWQVSLGGRIEGAIYAYGLIPDVLLGDARLPPELRAVPAWATVFTSMFLHGGWMHLIGNMLYLWIFADNVEDRFGHGRFVVFYALCGIAAAMAQALPDPQSQVPMVGASGAISGVLGAYLLMFPRAHVLVLVPLGFLTQLVRLPALLVLGLWFAMQLLSEMLAPPGAGVAFRAHIGGFVAGMLLLPLFRRGG